MTPTVWKQSYSKHTKDKNTYNKLSRRNANQLLDKQINARPHSQKGQENKTQVSC